ncbi:MAG: hypothetical protein Roseis2KO_15280 [Roseivirga sp.]
MKNTGLLVFLFLWVTGFSTSLTSINIKEANTAAAFLLTSSHTNNNDEKAEEILEKYIRVIGGEKAIESIETLSCKYNAAVNTQRQSIFLSRTTHQKSPDKYLEETIMDGERILKRIYNQGESKITNVYNPLSKTQQATLKYAGIMFPERFYSDLKYQPTFISTEMVDGVDTYKIRITIDGLSIYENYEIESGLKVRFQFGEGNWSTLSDYKEVEGVKIPFKFTIDNSRFRKPIRFTLKKVKVNEGIKDDLFAIK